MRKKISGRERKSRETAKLNKLSQMNPDNANMQNMLLQQYMGMAFPEQRDPDNELNRALTMMQTGQALGVDSLTKAGESMLGSNPLTSDYFGQQEVAPSGFNSYDSTVQSQYAKQVADMQSGESRLDKNKLTFAELMANADQNQMDRYNELKDSYGGIVGGVDAFKTYGMDSLNPFNHAFWTLSPETAIRDTMLKEYGG